MTEVTRAIPIRGRWPAVALSLGVAAAAVSIGLGLFRYPRVLEDPDSAMWTVLLVAVFLGYTVAAARALAGPASLQQRTGLIFAAGASIAWLAEMWTQAPARLPVGLERVVPALCALAAIAVTIAAGVTEGVRSRHARNAATVGLWAGLGSGTVMVVGVMAIQLSNMELLGARVDYQAELARSGTTDMPTYLAADAIAASLMHMVLNVALGLVGAAVGAAIASRRRQRRPHGQMDLG